MLRKSLLLKDSRGGTRTPDLVINSRRLPAAPFAFMRSHNNLA